MGATAKSARRLNSMLYGLSVAVEALSSTREQTTQAVALTENRMGQTRSLEGLAGALRFERTCSYSVGAAPLGPTATIASLRSVPRWIPGPRYIGSPSR